MFRRSSYCDTGSCVEVWIKSTRSAGNGACVELAFGDGVLMRDSKDPRWAAAGVHWPFVGRLR